MTLEETDDLTLWSRPWFRHMAYVADAGFVFGMGLLIGGMQYPSSEIVEITNFIGGQLAILGGEARGVLEFANHASKPPKEKYMELRVYRRKD